METRRWYCSFVDGESFLGAAVVWGSDCVEAIKRTHDLGINPGGEVLGIDITDVPNLPLPMDRLLSKEEIGPGKRLGDLNDAELHSLGL